jgi:hypothetical protein
MQRFRCTSCDRSIVNAIERAWAARKIGGASKQQHEDKQLTICIIYGTINEKWTL